MITCLNTRIEGRGKEQMKAEGRVERKDGEENEERDGEENVLSTPRCLLLAALSLCSLYYILRYCTVGRESSLERAVQRRRVCRLRGFIDYCYVLTGIEQSLHGRNYCVVPTVSIPTVPLVSPKKIFE
jgi:hypothetical protein